MKVFILKAKIKVRMKTLEVDPFLNHFVLCLLVLIIFVKKKEIPKNIRETMMIKFDYTALPVRV